MVVTAAPFQRLDMGQLPKSGHPAASDCSTLFFFLLHKVLLWDYSSLLSILWGCVVDIYTMSECPGRWGPPSSPWCSLEFTVHLLHILYQRFCLWRSRCWLQHFLWNHSPGSQLHGFQIKVRRVGNLFRYPRIYITKITTHKKGYILSFKQIFIFITEPIF